MEPKSLFEQEAVLKELNKKAKAKPSTGKALFDLIVGLAMFSAGYIWSMFAHGFVAHMLWGWFVVPLFHCVALSIWQAVGIMLLIRLATYTTAGAGEMNTKSLKWHVWITFLFPWFVLFVGWVIHFFI